MPTSETSAQAKFAERPSHALRRIGSWASPQASKEVATWQRASSRTNRMLPEMRTPKLFWFFVWRMALWGLLLGAAVMVVMLLVFVLVSWAAHGELATGGLVWGTATIMVAGSVGAVAGLALGLLCGSLLFALTRGLHYPRLTGPDSYPRTAGRLCSAGSTILLLADWTIHGLRDRYTDDFLVSDDFILWRIFMGDQNMGEVYGWAIVLDLGLMVVLPTLLFAWAMWWAGRRVADRYAVVSRGL
jgi:hypothetical protein